MCGFFTVKAQLEITELMPSNSSTLYADGDYHGNVLKYDTQSTFSSTEAWEFSIADRQDPHSQVYVTLKPTLNGTHYNVKDDRVFFRFDERYNSGELDCKIVNSKGETIEPSIENTKEGEENSKSAGYNCYEIDLKPYQLNKGFYRLEVRNTKNVKYLLKLYVD